MKVAVLQKFLQSLLPALEAAGDARVANDLSAAGQCLQAFGDMEIADFNAFLVRAKAYQASGAVAVPAPGEREAENLIGVVGKLGAAIKNGASDVTSLQSEVADALAVVAKQSGLKGKLSPDPKWIAAQQAKARIAPHAKTIYELAARIVAPEVYNETPVRDGIAQLAGKLDRDALKSIAAQFGVKSGTNPEKVLQSILVKLSGHQPAKGKKATAAADPAVVEEHARRLAALVERSANPDAVTAAEIEAELARLKELKKPELAAVAIRAGIDGVRPSDGVKPTLERIRSRLTAARRARERAAV